jgi:PhzF family phenazine biosynthesis protein
VHSYRFKQVDVFTSSRCLGNPLAVVFCTGPEACAVPDDAAMQRFARWTNLSETAFLLPPLDAAADYRVRIFTPAGELPFAGHPTLGSCHGWLEAGGVATDDQLIVQQCNAGLVKIRREAVAGAASCSGPAARLDFAAPALKRSLPADAQLAEVSAALGLPPARIIASQILDNGPVWLGLLLDAPESVLQLMPDYARLARLGVKVGVASFYERAAALPLISRRNREAAAFGSSPDAVAPAAPDMEVRAFAPSSGINEDPVTGSLNASLAQWLMASGHAPPAYIASQGTCLGREGRVHLQRDVSGQVWVGGVSLTCIDGIVML